MTTFGSFPGVQVQTQGGGISGVQVGSEETLVIFGQADLSSGSATVEEPTQVGSRQDADAKFGAGSELANAVKEALANGANINYLYGVAIDTTSVTAESFTGSATGTLANEPIVEDISTITVTDVTASTETAVEFRYDSPPTAPTDTDTVHINPLTGEWAADESSEYEFDYEYQEWQDGFGAADTVVNEDETAVYAALSDAESVAVDLSGKVTTLRGEYQMVKGLTGAQPNANSSESPPDPSYDTATYDDAVNDDAMFLIAPARKADSTDTIIGGVAGLFAGHAINEPVYNDAVSGYTDLEQKLARSEAQDLRDAQVIPVRQSGTVRVKDNTSTSDETDWERDFWRRRIVDRVILLGKIVGDATVGRINDETTRNAAESTLFAELDALVGERLLEPNTGEETNWYVDVYQEPTDPDQVNIDIGITPQGIVKRVDESITINT